MIQLQQQAFTSDLEKKIHEGFCRHALATTGYNGKSDPIAFVATEQGTLVGVVVIEVLWGALHIKHLYVEESHRAQRMGTRLMNVALVYGQQTQCPFAFVETMSFQALGFYQKMGFNLEFTRLGYKYDTSRHYLRKEL